MNQIPPLARIQWVPSGVEEYDNRRGAGMLREFGHAPGIEVSFSGALDPTEYERVNVLRIPAVGDRDVLVHVDHRRDCSSCGITTLDLHAWYWTVDGVDDRAPEGDWSAGAIDYWLQKRHRNVLDALVRHVDVVTCPEWLAGPLAEKFSIEPVILPDVSDDAIRDLDSEDSEEEFARWLHAWGLMQQVGTQAKARRLRRFKL